MEPEEKEGRFSPLLARLSRISSSGRFIPEIDGLRFIAIAGVVLYHFAGFTTSRSGVPTRDPLYMTVMTGFFGVQLFFVISGFILSLPFAEHYLEEAKRPALGRYYARRLWRLEPPYIINLLVLFGALLAVQGGSALELWPNLLASLTYTHNLVFGDFSRINPVAWSLEIEVQFYLVAPFLARVFAVRRATGRRLILIAGILASALIAESFRGPDHPRLGMSLAGQLHYFLLGFLLADGYLVDGRPSPAKGYAWDVLGILSWVGIGLGLTWVDTPRPLLLPLILVAFMAAFRGRLTNSAMRFPWITTIGGMCYTIYLYHAPLISGLTGFSGSLVRPERPFWQNYVTQLVLVGIPVLVLSALLFAFLERPFMRPRSRKACISGTTEAR